MTSSLLSIRGLRTYVLSGEPPVKAVDGIDLDIKTGETVALVGESGCGKTMLALSIGKLLPPHARIVAGQILFQGKDIVSMKSQELRSIRGKKIGYVFQDPMSSLNPVMTIGQQIEEAIRLHGGLSGQAARSKTIELLEQVQIPLPQERIHQYPHQLSGGMRQRAMIAMAISGRPSLLVADEPTTALDVTTQAEILALLKNLKVSFGMAVLLITHDLTAVADAADRIAVMYAGRIVELSTRQQLYKKPVHPYTQALLACLPKVGQGRQTLQAIPGTVPDLRFTPPGCPFHPRCPEAIPLCREREPALKKLDGELSVSCWRREPLQKGNQP